MNKSCEGRVMIEEKNGERPREKDEKNKKEKGRKGE